MPSLLLSGRLQPAEVLDGITSHEVQEHGRNTPQARSWPPQMVDCVAVATHKQKFPEHHVFLLHIWLL